MTPEQEQIAESLIAEMKRQKGTINWKPFRDSNSIDGMDMTIVVKGLRELGIIENFHGDTTVIRLTEKLGWTFPGFEAQRHIEKEIKDKQDQINDLTLRKLKLDQFPAKFWWLILLISAFMSIVTTVVSTQISHSITPTDTKQQEQSLSPSANSTKNR